ncbi:FtsH protease activity modulator HflK [Poseidonocella sp. HB161398]|uniref:FtsH protease activity modulator HflK n=1 Tax=Poseidonocella sp. HB161398 TaxID=2320855 RepID=UPI001109D3E1|nr:FtsH protease activity modulator HflK [Poseidonocella sp. HB161398]
MANSGGPWGGGNRGSGGGNDNRGGGRKPGGDGSQIPEIDEIMKKGQEQLRVILGGRGGKGGGNGGGFGGGGFKMNRGTWGLVGVAVLGFWLYNSLYTVRPEENSVELFLGKYSQTGTEGLNFAPWPFVTHEVIPVSVERVEELGVGRSRARGDDDGGLMLTTDEAVVDIDYQVVWNVTDAAAFLFNLRDPQMTVRAVSESAMREIIAQSELAPILNRDRGLIQDMAHELIQATLDSYGAGINIVRVNLDKADPPEEVIDSFREVQAAEQERDRLQRQADAYANRVLAGARGESAQLVEEAEGYRARVINEAQGEASRFSAVLEQYRLAPDVTRERLYLETMEKVLGDVDKVLLDPALAGEGGSGVVPYLPLNELRRPDSQ